MNHEYTAHYGNVTIRPLLAEDIELLRQWRNDKDNSKYLRQIPYITQEMQKKWFENYLQNNDEICFAIIEAQTLNRVVGSLSLYNFSDKSAEFGKILIGDVEAHGKGVGYNAIHAVLDIAFNELGLEKVFLHVYDNNKVAVHLYDKVGFKTVSSKNVQGMKENYMEISTPGIR